jgi:hypothetical protein
VLDFFACAVVHPAAAALGVGPLRIRTDELSWIVGSTGAATGDARAAIAEALATGSRPDPATPSPPATLNADRFELSRAFAGRRSAAQISGLGWTVDPMPYLPLFGQPPFFRLPDDDLVE